MGDEDYKIAMTNGKGIYTTHQPSKFCVRRSTDTPIAQSISKAGDLLLMLWLRLQLGPSERSVEAHRLCIAISRSAPTRHIYKAVVVFT
jgi:hypothetical protein